MIRLLKKEVSQDRAPHFLEVRHSEELHRVQVRRSKVAQRFTLRVRAATRDVVLTMPLRSKVEDAQRFAEQNAAWIGARIRRLPQPVPFADGATIPLRGIEHLIVHCPDQRGTVWTEAVLDCSNSAQNILYVAGREEHVSRRVLDFLKRQAKLELTAAVEKHCANLGVTACRVSLRDTTSRWGSCSASGNLNFSWRLILAPDFVLNYLAAHEVAHLRHLNHSHRFWALTRKLCSDTDRAEVWLGAHGMELHKYGKVTDGT